MPEILVCSVLAFVYVGLLCMYIHWFAKNAQPIWRETLCSVAFRALILVSTILWIRPAYSARMATDADLYYQMGMDNARFISNGQWYAIPHQPGTEMMGVIAAALYLPTHASIEAMYAISVIFSLVAATLFWAAVTLWKGVGAARKVAIALMLWPSLLYWTGAFGKDSLGLLAMALVTHAYSRMCHKGLLLTSAIEFISGLVLVGAVRPHYAFLFAASLAVAELYTLIVLRRPQDRIRNIALLSGMLFFAVLCWTAVAGLVSDGNDGSPVERLVRMGEYSAIGDSAIDYKKASTLSDVILNLPSGAVTVLFRPWLWEANNLFAFLAALENTVLLCLALWNWRSVLRSIAHIPSSSFGVFCFTMLVLLIFINSTGSNLGAIARTKMQLIPFLMAIAVSGINNQKAAESRRRSERATRAIKGVRLSQSCNEQGQSIRQQCNSVPRIRPRLNSESG